MHQSTNQPRPSGSHIGPVLRTRKVENRALQCTAKGCSAPRHSLTQFCSIHNRADQRHGHPQARRVDAKEYREEARQVAELFALNPDHQGTAIASGFIAQWMAEATERTKDGSKGQHGDREVSRVARHGVTPLEVLTAVCAAHAWLARNPNALPTDRARSFLLAKALCRCAPRPRRISTTQRHPTGRPYSSLMPARPTDVEAIGKKLQAALSMFLVNVAQSLKTSAQRELDKLDAMRQPFVQ